MSFPAKRDDLSAAGYHFEHSRPCRRCGAPLEFWRTPTHALAPLEVIVIDGEWLLGSHFATCPFAKEFRKRPEDSAPRPRQKELFS